MQKKIKEKICIRKLHTNSTKKLLPNSTSTTENKGAGQSTFFSQFLNKKKNVLTCMRAPLPCCAASLQAVAVGSSTCSI
jgi:hypothetical protein